MSSLSLLRKRLANTVTEWHLYMSALFIQASQVVLWPKSHSDGVTGYAKTVTTME